MDQTYHVTVTDWSERRGYRNSGRGWRVRCFSMSVGDWNAMARTIEETYHRTEAQARKQAAVLCERYQIEGEG